jgi:DNA-directed RNA polymerase subunit H
MPKKTSIGKQEFNIMGHQLVPHHSVISETEKKEMMEKYNITADQLPKILDTDPVAASIGAKPGQIIKVMRKSHTAKEAIAYRLVIESNK